MKTVNPANIKRIAVIRLDRVGDLILSTPFFKNLRLSFPAAYISAIVRPYTEQILKNNPDIDEILVCPDDARKQFSRKLRRGNYDMVISLSPVTASYRMAAQSGAPIRASYVYADRFLPRIFTRFSLTHCPVLDVRKELSKGNPVIHEVLQTFTILQAIGGTAEEYPLMLYPSGKDSVSEDHNLIGVHLSAKWFTGGWTYNDFKSMIELIDRKLSGKKIMITFGSMETGLAADLRSYFDSENIFFKGNLDFEDWALEIGRCPVFVSPDTGALHCAVAMGCYLVAVYDEAAFLHCSSQWAPWKVNSEIIRKTVPEKTITEIAEKTLKLYDERIRGTKNG